MPRRGASSASHSRSGPAAHAPLHNPPQPAPLQSGNVSVSGGLGAAVADGLAIGIGSAIAHWAVDSMMGPRVIHHETVASSASAATPALTTGNRGGADTCGGQFKAMQDCLNNYGSDISKCQFYMDMRQECRRSSAAGLGA